eukprot:CAMPEP_0184502270 /NCGR_PEP_ID=MMETSP0113_2-20130426/49858_1 /TAXON_ID=91329 /ORGANISM="Norrisiella sphaerica, Strain BC52" /LENGTH=146 /DNA_ID=CAMNT_0026891359 /DNA_START=228 /DNA_END=668 /DNA_ORIENTATION=-
MMHNQVTIQGGQQVGQAVDDLGSASIATDSEVETVAAPGGKVMVMEAKPAPLFPPRGPKGDLPQESLRREVKLQGGLLLPCLFLLLVRFFLVSHRHGSVLKMGSDSAQGAPLVRKHISRQRFTQICITSGISVTMLLMALSSKIVL